MTKIIFCYENDGMQPHQDYWEKIKWTKNTNLMAGHKGGMKTGLALMSRGPTLFCSNTGIICMKSNLSVVWFRFVENL